MTAERWREIEAIYQSAVDLDGNQQVVFIEEACGSDHELRNAVYRLLAADGDFGGAIEAAIRDEAEDLACQESEPIVGKRIGPYRITAVIATGGMGAIYRAERDDDEYQKDVAIKIIKRGMDLDAVVRRFRRERQILACLEHLNIARLIDGGATEDGQPYFVMEYVEGRPLTEHCATLPIEDRLRLFRQVCTAVGYAHRNRIVHRDLKPANILVTKDGIPKLLDFGLAKVLSPDELPEKTYTFLRIFTPDYASPEQVRGEEAGTGSDIYSLGAIFYELISGRRAHQFMIRTTAEMERVICKEDPPRLPGDLGSITRMAMRKDPQHRYIDVEQFSEDLRRHLEHLPVMAHRRDIAYRARKYIRRNRVAIAASTVALLSIGTAVAIAMWPTDKPVPLRIRPITALPGNEGWPDLSPDGKNVVFSWKQEDHGGSSVYLVSVDDGRAAPVRLTDQRIENDWSPAWSPDGREIAFRRTQSIYLISPSGGPPRKLADDPYASTHLSWSADGKWLATARYPAAYTKTVVKPEMALISTDTGERKVLSRREAPAFDDTPVFSPDGKRLAYMACSNGNSCELTIQDVNPSIGLTSKPLRLPARGEMYSFLAWSPDQKWIVYSRLGPSDRQGLWQVSVKGGKPASRLPLPGERFTFPKFARTGNRLLVAQEHLDRDILSIPLNGPLPPRSAGEPSRWAWSTRFEGRPDFSPDGNKVVFVSERAGSSDLWLANADGSDPLQMTNHFGSAEGGPAWSPDGRSIAFTSLQDGNADIWVMDADGARKRKLTLWPSTEADPRWSRDGTRIYFRSDRTGRSEVWRVRLDGGDPQQITTEGGWFARESADGPLLYFTKQPSSPLFVKPLSGGVERQVLEWIEAGCFVTTAEGIYYVGRRDGEGHTAPLSFHDFRSGRHWVIRTINAFTAATIAVSPDRRTILVPVFDPPDANPSSDLMLIENFR